VNDKNNSADSKCAAELLSATPDEASQNGKKSGLACKSAQSFQTPQSAIRKLSLPLRIALSLGIWTRSVIAEKLRPIS
jgi:hypothetical protein